MKMKKDWIHQTDKTVKVTVRTLHGLLKYIEELKQKIKELEKKEEK